MAKKTTYQKLKERVATLENDIRELVLRPDSFESQMIKSDILFTEQMDKFARFEDSDSDTNEYIKWNANGIKQVGKYSVKVVSFTSMAGNKCHILDIWITGNDCTKDANIRRLVINGEITHDAFLKKADFIFKT